VTLEERLVRVISNLRFTLNAARSPVNRFQPEVLSQIFAYLHAPKPPSLRYPLDRVWERSHESLVAVTLVCRYWRRTAIAHSTTAAVPDFEHQNWKLKKRPGEVAGSDFEMMRVLGEGYAGKVLLVRHKPTSDLFAVKAIAKRHALAKQELARALTEQAVLRRMAAEGGNPFVVQLWWTLHDYKHLFLVLDFHPGGSLATQLARWGRFDPDRARFYAAEIVEGIGGLHKNGIIYRDLKPGNVLIGSDGHVVLTNFGFSMEFPHGPGAIAVPPNGTPNAGTETTSTFRGTAKYTAPEVTKGLPYGFEVNWWNFGMMLYEMLTGTVWILTTSLEGVIC